MKRLFMWVTEKVDHAIGWYRLPRPLALVVLTGIRMRLRRSNLFDPSGAGASDPVGWGPERLPKGPRPESRTITGRLNDLAHAGMGSAGSVFGRNTPKRSFAPQDVFEPNPRLISEKLLARREFIPATSLNVLAASWLQFEVHDWMSHGENEPVDQFQIDLAPDDPWTHERPMLVERTRQGPPTTDGGPPTYRNTETHWWDASQVYGSTRAAEDLLRTRRGGKLHLAGDHLIPFNPASFPLGHEINLAGVAGNWWVGLAMMHTVFMREHNLICDTLAAAYPDWDDDKLFDHARLINAAQIAKIHTVEWTPALLTNPTLVTAMNANWSGLLGSRLKKKLGHVNLGEELSGVVGSKSYDHGVPYAMTEEFVAVYRMHPLIPDTFNFRHSSDNATVAELEFNEMRGQLVDDVLGRVAMSDLFYSFGTSHPGAIVLHNYPNHLRAFERPDGVTIDLATYDIVKCRERGVPRYNDFRRTFHLKPAKTFDDFSTDKDIVNQLRTIYAHPDDVDVMVGLFAEAPPPGFAFSDTAFRVFALMATRRLKSDRFYTYDYRPEVYTPEGMDWIDTTSMSKVLLRHYPELKEALHGVKNAFHPWNVPGPTRVEGTTVSSSTGGPVVADPSKDRGVVAVPPPGRFGLVGGLRWKARRGFWNRFAVFKFRHQEPTVIPLPEAATPLGAIAFSDRFPEIPITGIVVADRVPDDEAQPTKQKFSRFQEFLERHVSPMQGGSPGVDGRADEALRHAVTKRHRSCYPAPVRPDDFSLGALATAGPYAGYLQHVDGGKFSWDLSSMRQFEYQPGLTPLGAKVDFELDPGTGRPQPVLIETVLGTARPDTAAWDPAVRLTLCSITTHTLLIRHTNWLHLVFGGPLALTTRNTLPPAHPVKRLIWPHIFGTQYSNDMVMPILLSPGGDFESIFSLTHRGMCDLYSASAGDFQVAMLNPLADAAHRGIDGTGLRSPSLDNRRQFFDVFLAHARRYLRCYYASDDDVAADDALATWAGELDRMIPHGLGALTDGGVLNFERLVTLTATIINYATLEHEITGTGLWDYQLWNDVSPVRIYDDGRRVPVDVFQRLVNGDFNLNVHRTPLMSDFSGMAPDSDGADAFAQFRADLTSLQAELDRTPGAPWRMEPRLLKANINA